MGGKFFPTGGKFSAGYFIWQERDLFPGGIIFSAGRWTVPLSDYMGCYQVRMKKMIQKIL